MIIRRTLLLVCLLLLPLSGLAQETPQVYTIKKGDTLWGISEKFLKDPHYWPNLWANNPFVTNPHLIYPGQKVRFYDGRLEIVPTEVEPEVEPAPPAEPEPQQPEPQEAIKIKTTGSSGGFVTPEELDAAGTIVDTEDNRLLITKGDKVFLDMADLSSVRVGDAFSLFEVGDEVHHPKTNKLVGYNVTELGTLKVSELGSEVATAVIASAEREIQRGALLRPLKQIPNEIELKKSTKELSGYLVTSGDNKTTLGQFDVIYVDLGSEDGLEAGNLLYISRPREASEFALQDKAVELPDVFLGTAVVLQTYPETASALVLKVLSPLYKGDNVFTTVE